MSVRGHVLLFGWAFMELVAAEFEPWEQERRQPAFGGYREENDDSTLEQVRPGSKN